MEKKVQRSKRLASRAVIIMELQIQQGGEVFQEWPKYNKAWEFQCIQNFWHQHGGFEAVFDGCAYGLRAPEGGLMKKPWKVKSTSQLVWQLQRLCQCQEPHVPCEGGTRTRLSAFYPKQLCDKMARLVKFIHEHSEDQIMAVEKTPDYDPESVLKSTDQELMRVATDLLNLHKKLGHPGRQVFIKMLRDRGASTMVKTIAANLHCMDCEESAIPPARRAVTLEQATELWEVIQLDNMEFTVGDETFHFQVIVDEASTYGAANFLFKHPVSASRNPTTPEMLQALHQGWIQYFGYPKCIKLDKEGAHRGRQLEEWAEGHGIEIEAIPAEHHGSIGQVERLIGTLKQKLMAHLRSTEAPPEIATWAMIAAHNTMSNVGGYTPMQWVFGRNPTEADRLHDGPDLPYWSVMSTEEKMKDRLEQRLQAENLHRKLTLQHKINQAANTRMQPPVRYHPGDLVYYKRYQPPADKRERSHHLLDIPRRRVARWYGPARILALETKTSYEGQVRQPHLVAWIIASGRLKRVHASQLRFASERERVIAESHTPLATPWTFNDLTDIIAKGEFDDDTMTQRQQMSAALRQRTGNLKPDELASRKRPASQERPREEEDAEIFEPSPTGHSEPSPTGHHEPGRGSDEPFLAPEAPPDPRHEIQEDLDAQRLMADQHHFPMGSGEQGPLFQHAPFLRARARHERMERPYHVQRQDFLRQQELRGYDATIGEQDIPAPRTPSPLEEQADYVDEELNMEELFLAEDFEDYVFAVTIPEPKTEAEWRSIVKDPSKFVAKKMAKGVEVSWQKLNNVQKQAMREAKVLEINDWLASEVCRAAIGKVPAERLMRMRWVLVFKQTDTPGMIKAKARLVVLGFTDPDVGLVSVRSPTLSRRGRQLMLAMCTHKQWGFLKADAKTAFLQGEMGQQHRQIFGQPVQELKEAMGLKEGQAVQFLKAAYGLTIAPREFYLFVDEVLKKLNMERLTTEPCLWRLTDYDPRLQKQVTIGLVGAHVDDFLMTGDEGHPKWSEFLQRFHESLKWSPWECAPMMHCGVHLSQKNDGGWILDQKEFCESLNQVQEDGHAKELTESERRQCRAVLGSAQWRVYQTAPHHAAKLSHLQSILPKGEREVLKEINKFTRELYGQRNVTLEMHNLYAEKDEDVVAVAWSDAALANRADLGSTGGMLIGLVHKDMVDKGQKGPVNVISWGSAKLRRVCRSSLAAETQALAEAEQELMFVRTMWMEMMGEKVNLHRPGDTAQKMRGFLITDAKALYDSCQQGDMPSFSSKEKYTALEILALVQNMKLQATELRWCNSDMQLADGLTKVGAQDRMRRFLEEGQQWNVVYDPKFIAAKKLRARRLPADAPETEELGLGESTWLDLIGSSHTGHVNNSAKHMCFASGQ